MSEPEAMTWTLVLIVGGGTLIASATFVLFVKAFKFLRKRI